MTPDWRHRRPVELGLKARNDIPAAHGPLPVKVDPQRHSLFGSADADRAQIDHQASPKERACPCKTVGENRSRPQPDETSVREMDAYTAHQKFPDT
jgi:hypothetical protein